MSAQPDLARRGLLAVALAGLTAPVLPAAAAVAASHADAELLALGRQLARTWAEQLREEQRIRESAESHIDELWYAAAAPAQELARAIDGMTATTLDGVKVKAFACSWCFDGEQIEPDAFAWTTPGLDQRLAAGVLRDLVAIMGGRLA